MKESVTIVFTDGACSGNPGPGGWGAIIVRADGHVEELGGSEAGTTNNRMELCGAIGALEYLASARKEIILHTDSKYVIQGITGWIFGWRKNGWKTGEGKEVSNRDLWEKLGELNSKLKVTWRHVPGHSGIPANERCDEIATGFAAGSPPLLYSGKAEGYAVKTEVPDDLEQRAEWRSQKKKGGYYVSLLNGKFETHTTWAQCEARVKGSGGAKFQKCASAAEEADIRKRWGVE